MTEFAEQLMQAAGAQTDTSVSPAPHVGSAKQDEAQPVAGVPSTNQGRDLCS